MEKLISQHALSTTINGVLTILHENGSHLAVYDSSKLPKGEEERNYDSLHFLKEGDRLKITNENDNIEWEGQITSEQIIEEGRLKTWVNSDLTGARRKFVNYFKDGLHAELTTKLKPLKE